MINLLPPAVKEDYRYARRNRRLLHWVFGALAGLIGLAALTSFGFLYMNHSISTYTTTIASDNASLAQQNVTTVENQVQDISNNLKLVVQVLSHEIVFTDLLKQLATVTPPNVILTGLSISQTENAIDITAQSTNYSAGTQLQANLADPTNQIFSSADLVSITCTTKNSGSGSAPNTSSAYPCNVSIRALFAKNNPFLFINSKAAS